MNAVDTLFSNTYAACLILGVIYHVAVVRLALLAEPGPWNNFARLTVELGTVSGRAVLIMIGACALIALVLNAIGLPKTALWTLIGGVSCALCQISFYFTKGKLHAMEPRPY